MGTTYSPRAIGGVSAALTADSGSIQAGATLCDQGINIVGTVATIADSCIMPADVGQYSSIIVTNQAANSLDLFPNVGGAFDGGTANIAVAVAGGATVELIQSGTDGLAWVSH